MKRIAAIILIVIAVVMIFISFKASILPPGLTGIGFLAIATVFLKKE